MKKIVLAALFAISLASCRDIKSEMDSVFKGEFVLRRLSPVEVTTPSHWSASYFLLMASASGEGEKKENYVSFSWRMKNGEYLLSKVKVEDVRLKFDNKIDHPYITFGYNADLIGLSPNQKVNDIANFLVSRMDYVVIHCKESDYLPKIDINSIR